VWADICESNRGGVSVERRILSDFSDGGFLPKTATMLCMNKTNHSQ